MRDIDRMVEDWHNGAGEGQELHEYLGLSWKEYVEQCVPIPQELFDRCEEIRKLAEENRKRDLLAFLLNQEAIGAEYEQAILRNLDDLYEE